jgi:hypothetical protein
VDALRYFVGRTELVEEILQAPAGSCYVVTGPQGSGKSWLLEKLKDDNREEGAPFAHILLDAHRRPPPTAAMAAIALERDQRAFREIVKKLVSDTTDEDVDVRLTARAKPGRSAFAPPEPDDSYKTSPEQAMEAIAELTDQVRERLAIAAGGLAGSGTRLLILVDDMDAVAGRPLGSWLLDLLMGLPGTTVVLTQKTMAGLPADDERIVKRTLGNLSAAEVAVYLRRRIGDPTEFDHLAELVYGYTDGHPMATALTSDLISQGSNGMERSLALVRRLSASQTRSAQQLRDLVHSLTEAIEHEDEALRNALDCLWIVRRFDRRLLQHLLDEPNEATARGLIGQLSTYSFVQSRTGTRPADAYYTIHEFVRDYAERELLAAQDPDRYADLHKRAEQYYAAELENYEDISGAASQYDSWFRYEDPHWQSLRSEWLYHVAHLEGANRVAGRLSAARLFLDAFWWWGCYLAFPFCEQILADGALAVADDEDQSWLDNLKVLSTSYPKGWRKGEAPAESWRAVRQALLFLEQRSGLSPKQALEGSEEGRHLRGILDIFLAHCSRYLDPNDTRADERLADALVQFDADEDAWNTAWVHYEWADLALDRLTRARHQPAATEPEPTASSPVLAHLAPVAASAEALDDRELLANAHRVHADLAWSDGDAAGALDAYARAALHAYHFQIKDQPDEYTAAFLSEMVERTVERLGELLDAGRVQEVEEGCGRIQKYFEPYWSLSGGPPAIPAPASAKELAGAIFPSPPAGADLHKRDSPYTRVAREVADMMRLERAEHPAEAAASGA